MNTQRTAQRAKVAHARPTERATREANTAKNRLRANYIGEDISTCTKCPTESLCNTCFSINMARIKAGLMRPKHMEVDHPNNCLYSYPHGKGRVPERLKSLRAPVITAHIRQLGGGWRQGLASLNGQVIYEGPKTQSMAEAWDYAKRSVLTIKSGVDYARRTGQ